MKGPLAGHGLDIYFKAEVPNLRCVQMVRLSLVVGKCLN